MEQTRMQWSETETRDRDEPCDVVLSPETVETVIGLMARALIEVVHAAEEAADER